MSPLSKVISVCVYRDSAAFARAARYVPQFIAAERYEVVVPDHEAEAFRALNLAPYVVVPESDYLGHRTLPWLKAHFPPERAFRAGWYLQQFVKVEALRSAGGTALIWDADTVPLKPLAFETADGKVGYYQGKEHHPAYFQMVRDLLGLEKLVDFSFIAQCFAIKSAWVQEFIAEIEQRHPGKHWIDAVLQHLDYEDGCGFSEYETMGTWLTHRHLNEMVLNNGRWQRLGNSLLGGVGNLTAEKVAELSQQYDYLSFENWDHGQHQVNL